VRIVVMGVAGAGKTSVGRLLAQRLGCSFIEGDEHHPPENVARMSRGRPLGDTDRWPWLDALGRALEAERVAGRDCVLACSALKRSYRERLRGDAADLFFVHLDAPYEELAERLRQRRGHYMPAELLESQLAALEPLEPDERGLVVEARESPDELARRIALALAEEGHQRPSR
jgi:gluconokinase